MAEIIHTPLTVIHVLACVFLMLVVLIQPGKSGGLGALSGAGAQQVFGGRGAGNFLTKTTWATAGIFFATSMTLAYLSSSKDESLERRSKLAQEKKAPVPVPVGSTSPVQDKKVGALPWRGAVVDAILVGLTRAVLSVAWLWTGFRAISDDDYSRVTIAARFAAEPSLDPSGTSWLPLPFWLYGVAMSVLGDSLATARGVALLLGVLSALLVWAAARVFGASPRAALWGALGAALLPYGSWLSVATVPEAPTAALVLFGAAALVRPEPKLRFLGGLSLGAACFCRYEAWPAALAFAICTGFEAWRERRRSLWLAALVAVAPVALWLLHGVVRHGDALFFVARVTQYRAALGGPHVSALSAWLQTPLALLRFEPELVAWLLVALALSRRVAGSLLPPHAWRTGLVLGVVVSFLVLADVTGGSATHHPERSLLPVFWGMALLCGVLVARLFDEPAKALRWLALALPLAIAGHLLVRPELRSSFAQRSSEEELGRQLRAHSARQVALDTDDFGYFAVQAALGYGASWPLSDLDPRKPRAQRPRTTEELGERLRADHSAWLVTTQSRVDIAAPLGVERLRSGQLVAIELTP